jgi:hypothetical protein
MQEKLRKAKEQLGSTKPEEREAAHEVIMAEQMVLFSIEAAKDLYEKALRSFDAAMKIVSARTSGELTSEREIAELCEVHAQSTVAHKLVETGAVFVVQIREHLHRIRQSEKWKW